MQGSVFRRIYALLGEFRVDGGFHDSCTFQCGLVGYFTSPGMGPFKCYVTLEGVGGYMPKRYEALRGGGGSYVSVT